MPPANVRWFGACYMCTAYYHLTHSYSRATPAEISPDDEVRPQYASNLSRCSSRGFNRACGGQGAHRRIGGQQAYFRSREQDRRPAPVPTSARRTSHVGGARAAGARKPRNDGSRQARQRTQQLFQRREDRKSTRLNSSHVKISYA